MPTGKGDAQSVGSATTYGRRYALMAILGLAPDDDDGQAASTAPGQQVTTPGEHRPASDGQLRTLGIRLRAAGYDRETGLAFIAIHAGRPVASSKELTVREASNVMDALPDAGDVPPPPEPPEGA